MQAALKAADEDAARARRERRHADQDRDRAVRELQVLTERLRAEVRRGATNTNVSRPFCMFLLRCGCRKICARPVWRLLMPARSALGGAAGGASSVGGEAH